MNLWSLAEDIEMRVGWAFNLFESITGWLTGIGLICGGHIRGELIWFVGSTGMGDMNPCCEARSGTDWYPLM